MIKAGQPIPKGPPMNTRLSSFLWLTGILILIAGCTTTQPLATPTPRLTKEPAWPTNDWPASTPEELGVDSEILADMLEEIETQDHQIDGLVIIRHGYNILEAAKHPYQLDNKHEIYSISKSVTSALIGIAIDQGYIQGVDQPLTDLFPEYEIDNLDAQKQNLTLENLLSMTTGFKCRDSYLYRWAGIREMEQSGDWVDYVLDLPMEYEPGEHFEYCNSATFLLSALITETTGSSALDFAEEHLFTPLGIQNATWQANPQGINIGYSGLHITASDLAKFGYLYLRGGEWNGEQIIPTDWVSTSTQEYTSATLEDGYGYQWWLDDAGYDIALGYSGQFIFVIPEKDMVVVFVSHLEEQDFYTPQNLLENYILPAAQSNEPLPPNPDGVDELNSWIEKLSSR